MGGCKISGDRGNGWPSRAERRRCRYGTSGAGVYFRFSSLVAATRDSRQTSGEGEQQFGAGRGRQRKLMTVAKRACSVLRATVRLPSRSWYLARPVLPLPYLAPAPPRVCPCVLRRFHHRPASPSQRRPQSKDYTRQRQPRPFHRMARESHGRSLELASTTPGGVQTSGNIGHEAWCGSTSRRCPWTMSPWSAFSRISG